MGSSSLGVRWGVWTEAALGAVATLGGSKAKLGVVIAPPKPYPAPPLPLLFNCLNLLLIKLTLLKSVLLAASVTLRKRRKVS